MTLATDDDKTGSYNKCVNLKASHPRVMYMSDERITYLSFLQNIKRI